MLRPLPILCALALGLVIFGQLSRPARERDAAQERRESAARAAGVASAIARGADDAALVFAAPAAPPQELTAEEVAQWTCDYPAPRAVPLLVPGDTLEEGIAPTVEGLYLRTVDAWSSPEFLELDAARLRELLGVDSDFALAPGTLFDLLRLSGGLPTRDDCARAVADPGVAEALTQASVLELAWLELAETPAFRRWRGFDRALEQRRRAYDEAALRLMRECERATSYPHWSTLHRAFEAWAQ